MLLQLLQNFSGKELVCGLAAAIRLLKGERGLENDDFCLLLCYIMLRYIEEGG